MNFSIYWQHADAISKTLYFVLLAMSIATWCIFILRVMATRQAKNTAVRALTQSVDDLKGRFSVLSTEQRKVVAEQALLQQMARSRVDIERGLPVLGTIASIAPFVGLFGTVWGIMGAFQGIAQTGSTNLGVVAPGIAEALIATAAGLFAAIPAVYFYNDLTNRVKLFASEMDDFSLEFLNIAERNFT